MMLNFIKDFPALTEMIIWLLFVNLLIWRTILFEFQILNHFCILGINQLDPVFDPSNVLLDLVCKCCV